MDIRKELKKLTVAQLKDIARRHNAHYIIKLKQSKADLIEKLVSLYDKMRNDYLLSNNFEVRTIRPKITAKLKEIKKLEIKKPEIEKQIFKIIKSTSPLFKSPKPITISDDKKFARFQL